MMQDDIQAILCPYCGLVFVAIGERVMAYCPICDRRFKPRAEELLEAELEWQPHG